jgi:hypothetical protein
LRERIRFDRGTWQQANDGVDMRGNGRRPSQVAVAIVAAVGILVVGVLGVVTALVVRTGSAVPVVREGGLVTIGEVRDIRVEVDELAPGILAGALGPAPRLDTDALGDEQPIDRTPVPPPNDAQPPAVLVGAPPQPPGLRAAPGTGPLFIYTRPAPIVDRLLALFDGSRPVMTCLGGAFGSSCGAGSQGIQPPGIGSTVADDPTIPVELTFHPLPVETSVVTVSDVAEAPIAWQRPVAGVSLWVLPMAHDTTVVLRALDADGNVLAQDRFRREPHRRRGAR